MARLNLTIADSGQPHTYHDLRVGELYTRDDLAAAYGISDSTLNNGVFRPDGKKSIWLFVTEVKTQDKTPYRDKLDGDILSWQGQTMGRTDNLIIDHQLNGDTLEVFYRKSKMANPSFSFRY